MFFKSCIRLVAVSLSAVFFLSGCGKEPVAAQGLVENVIDDKYRTTYEIFVYSFCDSDGDGIGDLNGVREKLDYINDGDSATDADLGCNQIWLMPISPSPTYHKYDVTDYKGIDPSYGTMDDFDALVSECHDRGINVIIDMVLNHTSVEHPWFTQAEDYIASNFEALSNAWNIGDSGNIEFAEADLDACPYLEYYNYSVNEQDGYEKLPGADLYYEARFWSGMPDLNLDSEKVREEISDITAFWTEHGVDGFRLDAVLYYYTGNDNANIQFLSWLNNMVKELNPDAYIVGEAWANLSTYAKYYKSGVDSFFDFGAAGSEGTIAGVARGTAPASNYAAALQSTEQAIEENSETGINAPFYTNHDMARSAGYYTGKGSQDKVKLAGALNLLTTGNAFIYYGEELGMKGSGKDENKRAPMQWSAVNADGMCDGPAEMENFEMKYPALDEQAADKYSIYNYYKKAIKLRNIYPVVARGITEPVEELSDKNISCFVRKETEDSLYDVGSLLIVVNTSDSSITLDMSNSAVASGYTKLTYSLNTSEETNILDGAALTIPAYGIAVLEK